MPASNSNHTLPALADLTDTQIAEASRAANEPEWLTEWRTSAWQNFAESTPPFWKRTDLSKFRSETITAPLGAHNTTLICEQDFAKHGVIFTTLADAIHNHGDLIKQHLGTAVDPTAHKFTALHAALWQDGAFLYVPKNVSIEAPFLATFTFNNGNHAIFPHNLIIVERGSSAMFVEEYVSDDVEGQGYSSPATEIFVGEDASLKYAAVQTWGKGVYHIGSQRVRLNNNSNLNWVIANVGGQIQHVEAETSLENVGSRVEWTGATFANGTQSLLTAPILRHAGTNTESHLDFKTVVDETGYSTFDGLIKIEHESHGTVTRLEEHAIHLSPKARTDSIPGLKIDTNDVARAGHASTSGQIDEEQLFYMLSRGIQRDEAKRMIVRGFFEPTLDRIPVESLRERITNLIEEKIR